MIGRFFGGDLAAIEQELDERMVPGQLFQPRTQPRIRSPEGLHRRAHNDLPRGQIGRRSGCLLGIAANCLAVALLLHYRKLVSLGALEWKEIGKALVVSVIAGFLGWELIKFINPSGSRLADLEALGLISVVWAAVVGLGLWLMKSKLPGDLRRRKQTGEKPANAIAGT